MAVRVPGRDRWTSCVQDGAQGSQALVDQDFRLPDQTSAGEAQHGSGAIGDVSGTSAVQRRADYTDPQRATLKNTGVPRAYGVRVQFAVSRAATGQDPLLALVELG